MNNQIVQPLPKPQMSESRSSTKCVVVERPCHHCGDALVMFIVQAVAAMTYLGDIRIISIHLVVHVMIRGCCYCH